MVCVIDLGSRAASAGSDALLRARNATDDRVIHTNVIRAAQADVTRETCRDERAEHRRETEDRQTDGQTDRRTGVQLHTHSMGSGACFHARVQRARGPLARDRACEAAGLEPAASAAEGATLHAHPGCARLANAALCTHTPTPPIPPACPRCLPCTLLPTHAHMHPASRQQHATSDVAMRRD